MGSEEQSDSLTNTAEYSATMSLLAVRSAARLVAVLAVTVFAAEIVVMTLLDWLVPPGLSPSVVALLDALCLTVAIAPAFYLMGFRPMVRQIARQGQIEARLRTARSQLEHTVAERTHELALANHELRERLSELQDNSRTLRLLTQVSALLQACEGAQEAVPVVTDSLRRMFPDDSGCLFLYRHSRDHLEALAHWGLDEVPDPFPVKSCWSLLQGKTHAFGYDGLTIRCAHTAESAQRSLCLTLSAQGDVIGVLHVLPGETNVDSTSWRSRLDLVAEELALALSNLKLREKLRQQAIRDGLTGLFNRRYLLESFGQEIRRAARRGRQMSVLMLDLDHFKALNDTHGHGAGDVVLRRFADCLTTNLRAEDIVARYGGEEFTAVLPEIAPELALARAEQIRAAYSRMTVDYLGTTLAGQTVSVGVASFPCDGESVEELLQAADRAMYLAKSGGRNRVETASTGRSPAPQPDEAVG